MKWTTVTYLQIKENVYLNFRFVLCNMQKFEYFKIWMYKMKDLNYWL